MGDGMKTNNYLNAIMDCLHQARTAILKGLKLPEAGKTIRMVMGDTTKLIDEIADKTIIKCLKEHFQNFRLVSEEEYGLVAFGDGSGPIFIVDPLDGSTNALRGYPCYSVSIAVAEKPKFTSIIAAGVINVVTGDVFTAVRGEGAMLNGKPVKPSNVKRVEDALISIDLNIRRRLPGYLEKLSQVIERARYFRFLGTNALETCFVAAGISDAFIDLRGFLRLTDFAAACFIVKEAGGVVVDEYGKPLEIVFHGNVRGKYIAACTEELCQEILRLIGASS